MEGKKGNEIRVSRYYMVMKVVVVVLSCGKHNKKKTMLNAFPRTVKG